MATLDRVIANTDWAALSPLATVRTLPKPVSDHTPILLDTGGNQTPPPKLFRFEKWWLDYPDFSDLVAKVWSTPCRFSSEVDIWQFKLRLLRKSSKGWSINVDSALKNLRKIFCLSMTSLTPFSETSPLSENERLRMKQIKNQLDKIFSQEETKAW